MKQNSLIIYISATLLAAFAANASPLGSAFTYQGRLAVSNNAAAGSFDFKFSLYDALSSGVQVGNSLTNLAVPVSDGNFTATLDFGASAFNGDARWLLIEVRTNNAGSFTPLSPRQPVQPTPYALLASQYTGSVSQGQLPANVALLNASQGFTGNNSFTGAGNSFSGSGSGLTSLNASALTSGAVPDARLSANVALENAANTFTAAQVFNSDVTINGSGRLWNTDLYFRQGGTDTNHGVGYYSGTFSWKPFGTVSVIDGPVLYGWWGGALGTKNGGNQEVLYWKYNGRVGIGTGDPQATLHVAGDLRVDGSMTWGTRTGYVAVAAAAFHPSANTTTYNNDGYQIHPSINNAWFYTGVSLPQGATVTKVTWDAVASGEGSLSQLRLVRRNLAGSVVYMAQCDFSGTTGTGQLTDTTITSSTVDNSQYVYYLDMYLTGPGGFAYGGAAIITYTNTGP